MANHFWVYLKARLCAAFSRSLMFVACQQQQQQEQPREQQHQEKPLHQPEPPVGLSSDSEWDSFLDSFCNDSNFSSDDSDFSNSDSGSDGSDSDSDSDGLGLGLQ